MIAPIFKPYKSLLELAEIICSGEPFVKDISGKDYLLKSLILSADVVTTSALVQLVVRDSWAPEITLLTKVVKTDDYGYVIHVTDIIKTD